MKTYTNFDSWKMMIHHISLGWLNYKGHNYNLDDKEHQLMLLNQLLNDKVIGFWNDINEVLDYNNLDKLYFKFSIQELENFNFKMDGNPNKMQYFTILINFKDYFGKNV